LFELGKGNFVLAHVSQKICPQLKPHKFISGREIDVKITFDNDVFFLVEKQIKMVFWRVG
jgi:hypothetical protein